MIHIYPGSACDLLLEHDEVNDNFSPTQNTSVTADFYAGTKLAHSLLVESCKIQHANLV